MKNLIERLRAESLYKDKCTLEIMDLCMEAALELERLEAENKKLRAELEKESAARKKQAAILCELRGQKYEQISVIDHLQAELKQAMMETAAILSGGALKMNNDIRAALMGNKEAAKKLTDAGVLIPCPKCGGPGEVYEYPGEDWGQP